MTDLDSFTLHRAPNPQRPLLGLTVLAVEDSRYAAEALRLMCLRSGARIRRADCLASARRHLMVYRPSVVVVDPGLPDGSGTNLLAELTRARPRVSVILASSGDPGMRSAALAAGADGFLDKPVDQLDRFQQEILRHLPPEQCPHGPYAMSAEVMTPDPLAYHDDLEHVRTLLGHAPDGDTLRYAAQFLASIGRAANDAAITEAAHQLTGTDPGQSLGNLLTLINARLNARAAI